MSRIGAGRGTVLFRPDKCLLSREGAHGRPPSPPFRPSHRHPMLHRHSWDDGHRSPSPPPHKPLLGAASSHPAASPQPAVPPLQNPASSLAGTAGQDALPFGLVGRRSARASPPPPLPQVSLTETHDCPLRGCDRCPWTGGPCPLPSQPPHCLVNVR